LQIATDNFCALIDVLALPSLNPLLEFLNDRNRLKVLHAAHQDLEVLALANGAALNGDTPRKSLVPISGPFLDTQVAAAFLDMPASIGYADLVQRRLNHTLQKGQSRTDWSQRPLSEAQLTYAADDVIYLVELYHDLKKALGHTLRWGWIAEEAEQLDVARLYSTEPAEAWQRLRFLDQLEPEQRAAAKALAEWREHRAMIKDRPRSWILSDDALRAIAQRLPTTIESLGAVAELPKGLIERRGDELLKLLSDSKAQAIHEPPAQDFRPSRAQQKQVASLMDVVRKEGARLHISPERLATRRDIEALVFSDRIGAFGQGWRWHNFGERLIKLASKEAGNDATLTATDAHSA
jgi:ribonuclease D